MLYNLIIAPIETIVEWVFNFIIDECGSLGVIGAVFGVSLVINFLALPLYNVADSLQEKERRIVKQLEPRVKKIKKAFKGNEQFMMLSTYYRQNDYHPLYVLRSSLSILIEIPFFIAAYHFLSNCELLRGASFWIFDDLGSPDSLLHIGKFSIHILPILMTLINFVSGAIYTKEAPAREKIQLYAVALLFLFLLYSSPSGLVIYWILNNLFSLIKNIVLKMKNPGKILHAIVTIIFFAIALYFATTNGALWKKAFVFAFALCILFIPILKQSLSRLFSKGSFTNNLQKSDFYIFIFSAITIALLCGLVLPASAIASSPLEFAFLGNTDSPLNYIYNSMFLYFGLFVLWPCIIYKMFGNKVKKAESIIFFILAINVLLNTYVFKCEYGNLNALFELNDDECLHLSSGINLLSMAAFLGLSIFIILLEYFNKLKYVSVFLMAICLAETSLGIIKTQSISTEYNRVTKQNIQEIDNNKIDVEYHLSKNHKNVVILFLDRAIGSYVPKIFDEYPEIKEKFSGFTYYPNTLSFSDYTLQGIPPMLGGYEYTQENINARSSELLREKHNESTLVMPKLFSDADFEVTVTDPAWPNYHWKKDLAYFADYPQINVSEIEGKYQAAYKMEKIQQDEPLDYWCKLGCIDFSFLQAISPLLRPTFYSAAKRKSPSVAKATSFIASLSNLYYLSDMTDFSATKNTFTYIENQCTHEASVCLNDDFETIARNQIDDETLHHYQANIAALKQIGKWLDYLKENNVFDNTRIIIVSDHGRDVEVPSHNENIAWYSALLMEKDFNSNSELIIDNTFMTNADTLFLAKEELSVANVNPFTGKEFVMEKENGITLYHTVDWNAENLRDSKQFELDKTQAWHVSDNIYEDKNWIPLIEWEKINGGKK